MSQNCEFTNDVYICMNVIMPFSAGTVFRRQNLTSDSEVEPRIEKIVKKMTEMGR